MGNYEFAASSTEQRAAGFIPAGINPAARNKSVRQYTERMIGVKSQPPESPPAPATSFGSGKLVIMAILAVALTGAAISWYFRYKATHRAAEFWGPKAARLIRDATHIELFKLAPSTRTDTSDTTLKLRGEIYAIVAPAEVSAARGMTHLRNALLEDVSFDAFGLGSEQVPPHYWRWVLYFRDNTDGQSVSVLFSDDCSRATLKNGNGATADCEPIAKGLREMFDEFISAP